MSSVNKAPPSELDSSRTKVEQPVTPPPTLYLRTDVRLRNCSQFSTEFQMTIRTKKVKPLAPKEASMLLMICNVLALQDGIDMSLYLAMEWLYAFLTKSGSISPEEVKSERIRQTCLLTHLIMTSFRGEWTDLTERIQIMSKEVRETIVDTGWLPDRRTFNSWLPHWKPEEFLEVRIVPLNTILERDNFAEPYSSYCKGYGEGGHRTRQSTRYDSELDGEEYAEPQPPEFNLLEVEQYQRIFIAIEAQKARRVQQRK